MTDAGRGAQRLTRGAGATALGTAGSRLLGAVRDAVIAASFPAVATDAFFVAFTIPNTLRSLLAEGAVSAAIVPTFTKLRETRGHAAARRFHARATGAMLLVLAATCAAGIALAEPLVVLFAGGYEPVRFAATVELLRVVFPYLLLVGIAAMHAGALQACGRFALPAAAPALLNAALIASPWLLSAPATDLGLPEAGALALGTLAGGLAHVLVQLPALHRAGVLDPPRFAWDSDVRRAFGLLVPVALGAGVYQLNVLLSRLFASYLPEGSQSWLYYGQRVVEIPQGMLALAVATASLPVLSEHVAHGRAQAVERTAADAVRLTTFLALPCALLATALAEPVVAVLFGRGRFDAHAIEQTARSLAVMGLGVWPIAIARNLVPVFHAHGDTRRPVRATFLNLIVFALVSVSLLSSLGHLAIAVGTVVGGLAQMIALVAMVRTHVRISAETRRTVARSIARTAVAAAVAVTSASSLARLGDWPAGGNEPRNWLVALGTAIVALVAFTVTARLLRSPELGEVRAALSRRRTGAVRSE
ncbi:MAG: murein biosynthesis integral membrane protein MurJ [Myxococcota bacterium]|nr:murein biosynthesis integral membrane protein MurJ [Myxococcota bacterium]